MPAVAASNKTVAVSATTTHASPTPATARSRVSQHSGSFLNPPPQHLYIHLRPEDGGGARALVTSAALEQGSTSLAGDVVVSLILVVIVVFISFMATFFWRKYRKISILRSAHAYEYSQLSQCERDAADLTEILDDLGVSINTSTDEEDLEPACPATISVTSSYISPHSAIAATNNNNNNVGGGGGKDADDVCKINSSNAARSNHVLGDIQPDLVTTGSPAGDDAAVTLIHSPVPLHPHMPPPLLPEVAAAAAAGAAEADGTTASVRLTHFTDSDEELLQ